MHSLPLWLTLSLGLLGLSSMLLTMLCPDNLETYQQLFHLQAARPLAVGLVLILG